MSSSKQNLCVRCAQTQKTCCQDTDIYLTPGDVERIGNHLSALDFFEFRPPSNAAYEEDDDIVWKTAVFKRDRTRRVLKQGDGGNCSLLTPTGCRLPLEVRPLICRLHPYLYDATGIVGTSKDCPTHLLEADNNLHDSLTLDHTQAQQWHATLYYEILMEDREGELPERTKEAV